MEFQQPHFLSEEQLMDILSSFSSEETLSIVKVRYKNKLPIKRTEQMTLEAFKEFVLESIESGWGSDVELYVPSAVLPEVLPREVLSTELPSPLHATKTAGR